MKFNIIKFIVKKFTHYPGVLIILISRVFLNISANILFKSHLV